MIDRSLPTRPWAPTADLEPAMKACERYIRNHDPLHPKGQGVYLPPEEAKAPEWQRLLARLDAASRGGVPAGGQYALFDPPES